MFSVSANCLNIGYLTMKKKKKKKLVNRKVLYSACIVAVLILIYVNFFSGNYSILKLMDYRDQEVMLEKEQLQLKKKVAAQKENNKLLENGDAFEIEKQARERGMIKKGEKVYKFDIKKEN